jgi:hypothetical protein
MAHYTIATYETNGAKSIAGLTWHHTMARLVDDAEGVEDQTPRGLMGDEGGAATMFGSSLQQPTPTKPPPRAAPRMQ